MDAVEAPYKKKSSAVQDRLLESLKSPPHSIEAEQSVLGGLMMDNSCWDYIVDHLNENDFYRHEHRVLFSVFFTLAEQQIPFDAVTLMATLESRNQLEEIGGEAYLFTLSRNTPAVANIKAYANIVRERSVLRQLISVANEVADLGYNPDGQEVTALLDKAEQKVFEIADRGVSRGGPVRADGLLADAAKKVEELFTTEGTITGISTGYKALDDRTSGLQRGDLVILAGRPSMGKTMLAMNIAESVAIETKDPVLIFSMEMPGEALAMRMLSSLGRINQQKIRSGNISDQDWPRISSSVSQLAGLPMYIDDTPAMTPSEVRSRARRLAREKGQLSLIVLDYLQLMRTSAKSENRATEISEISRSLKALAKELNVPVIALSQLNRGVEQRADRRPMMSDLRESGAIEQDADLIAFVYRDQVYNPDTPRKNIAELIIAKQRNGPIGQIDLAFFGEFMRFDTVADNSYSGPMD